MERLNKEVKYREEFRPFAPAVPLEVADRYFELTPGGARLGRFMSGVFRVRPDDENLNALLERGMPPERIHVSMERDMKCGVGHCGHCQLGPTLICRDGPVYSWAEIAPLMAVRQL